MLQTLTLVTPGEGLKYTYQKKVHNVIHMKLKALLNIKYNEYTFDITASALTHNTLLF